MGVEVALGKARSPSPQGAALRLTYWARRPVETLTERVATFWAGCVALAPAPAM